MILILGRDNFGQIIRTENYQNLPLERISVWGLKDLLSKRMNKSKWSAPGSEKNKNREKEWKSAKLQLTLFSHFFLFLLKSEEIDGYCHLVGKQTVYWWVQHSPNMR